MDSKAEVPSHSARETFSGRSAFIFAAIGSAVGLGNIWRFPYVAYTNGGGAFILPYLVALITAGIPLLFLFHAIGHRFRGSPPLAFRRLHPKTEMFGWWQVLICCVIGVYYAAVLAWAVAYVFFSIDLSWGSDPTNFFLKEYLQSSDVVGLELDFVDGVLWPILGVWIAVVGILALGVQKGIAKFSKIFIPLLFLMFLALVVQALSLPGALKGLDALFTPDWSKLLDSSIWIAAYGQIFFSLSVGFGIMLTYASYLKKNTNITSSGLVVAFANSSFEILAGIGVFAALGFIAVQMGQEVNEVATSGVGLAFIGFPTIISEVPFGQVFGILFFGSLVFAGVTSLISVLEVVISAVKDKLGYGRLQSTLVVGLPCAVISTVLFATTTGLSLLDIIDAFINSFGIVAASLAAIVTISVGYGAMPVLRNHLNSVSSFKVGRNWQLLAAGVTPLVLGYTLIDSIQKHLTEGYGGMPTWFVNTFGWGMVISLVVLAWLLSKLAWSSKSALYHPDVDGLPVADPIWDEALDVPSVQEQTK